MESEETFRAYLGSIRNYKIFSKEEQAALSDKARNGDTDAFNALVNSNLLLVVSVAKKFGGHGISIMDLIQEGNLGLLMAARRYKSSFNTRFSTYAYLWIQQYMIRYIQNKIPIIKLPFRKACLAANYKVCSFESPLNSDGSITLGDTIEAAGSNPEELLLKKMEGTAALSLVETLPPGERDVLNCRYSLEGGEPKTLREVGRLLGVTPETVRMTEKRALNRLREYYKTA